MLADAFTTVGALLALVGGLVATVATAGHLVWEAKDRKQRAIDRQRESEKAADQRPILETYSREQMRAYLAERAREDGERRQGQQPPPQRQAQQRGPRVPIPNLPREGQLPPPVWQPRRDWVSDILDGPVAMCA